MSAQNPVSITEWLQNLPIPWLVGGPNGRADVTSYGTVLDGQIDLIRQAVKSKFPDNAPTDALPHIGADRELIQGPSESNGLYVTRLLTAWDDWSRAGSPVELLTQLFLSMSFTSKQAFNVTLVQQNGLYFNLSAVPTEGADPTLLLNTGSLGTLPVPLVSSVNPSRSIPANTPWWTFDSDTDHCSRFAIVFSTLLPSQVRTIAQAVFTGVEDGSVAHPWPTITWPNVFIDTTYKVVCGAPTVTSGSPPGSVSLVGGSQTLSTAQIMASDSFIGTVDVIAYQSGMNPLSDLHPADLNTLRIIINRWRPARMLPVAIYIAAQGRLWGWPLGTWGNVGNWGPSSAVQYSIL